jgi:hypothetical protein
LDVPIPADGTAPFSVDDAIIGNDLHRTLKNSMNRARAGTVTVVRLEMEINKRGKRVL